MPGAVAMPGLFDDDKLTKRRSSISANSSTKTDDSTTQSTTETKPKKSQPLGLFGDDAGDIFSDNSSNSSGVTHAPKSTTEVAPKVEKSKPKVGGGLFDDQDEAESIFSTAPPKQKTEKSAPQSLFFDQESTSTPPPTKKSTPASLFGETDISNEPPKPEPKKETKKPAASLFGESDLDEPIAPKKEIKKQLQLLYLENLKPR